LVLAGRELTRLSGFTARVIELVDVLNDLNAGKYSRTIIHDNKDKKTEVVEEKKLINANQGDITEKDNLIIFDQVPLITPNMDVLIKDLTFTVHSGTNVLVQGPNGCGKSSLFRVLGGLWPIFGGKLTKPTIDKLFYVPQRPYMTLGRLRDQIIYPDSKEDMQRKNVTDEKLVSFLKLVSLDYILEREGGWEAIQDWMDVLSGGEKQRVAMARMFYHQPQFAILDECTSAVSVDVEGEIYKKCKELNITLFTISHRPSTWAFHDYVLQFTTGKEASSVRFITMAEFSETTQAKILKQQEH